MAKLLFLAKQARPDIQTAVAFLTTRVIAPTNSDMAKLKRVMKYLRGSLDLVMTYETNNMSVSKWSIDGSFAVHPDMRSHTGAILQIGKSTLYATSQWQKINTKSSTEAELVAVNDVLNQALWTRYFIQAQGYHSNESIIQQDNMSAILLEKNGRSSKPTRHINVRYYWVSDVLKRKEARIVHCPTDDLVGDFYTKPLTGCKFKKFRNQILNIDMSNTNEWCASLKRKGACWKYNSSVFVSNRWKKYAQCNHHTN